MDREKICSRSVHNFMGPVDCHFTFNIALKPVIHIRIIVVSLSYLSLYLIYILILSIALSYLSLYMFLYFSYLSLYIIYLFISSISLYVSLFFLSISLYYISLYLIYIFICFSIFLCTIRHFFSFLSLFKFIYLSLSLLF